MTAKNPLEIYNYPQNITALDRRRNLVGKWSIDRRFKHQCFIKKLARTLSDEEPSIIVLLILSRTQHEPCKPSAFAVKSVAWSDGPWIGAIRLFGDSRWIMPSTKGQTNDNELNNRKLTRITLFETVRKKNGFCRNRKSRYAGHKWLRGIRQIREQFWILAVQKRWKPYLRNWYFKASRSWIMFHTHFSGGISGEISLFHTLWVQMGFLFRIWCSVSRYEENLLTYSIAKSLLAVQYSKMSHKVGWYQITEKRFSGPKKFAPLRFFLLEDNNL